MIRRLVVFAAMLAIAGVSPGLAQVTSPPPALDPERLALATEIIDLSYPPEQRHAMLSRVADTMAAQSRTAVLDSAGNSLDDQGLRRIVERYLDRSRAHSDRGIREHSSPLFAAFARAYARRFTNEELLQIRAFVLTPAGRRFVQQASELLADPDVAEANTAYMRSVFGELEPMAAELARDVSEYLRTRRNRR